MKVRLLERLATPRGEIPVGQIITIPDHLAERLKGKIEPVTEDDPFERQKWGTEIERVTRAVCERFPGSLRDQMKDKRPDLYQRLKQAENDIDAGYDQGHAPRLGAALKEYVTVLEIAANEAGK